MVVGNPAFVVHNDLPHQCPALRFTPMKMLSLVCCVLPSVTLAADGAFELTKGDRVSIIGNTTADRMQHHGWLETYIHAMHPGHNLTFRNLGFPGDELKTRPRSASFGSADQWLTKTQADVVFCFFGYNEALRGERGLPGFKRDLAETIDGMLAKKYNSKSAPRLVFFSPIAHENLNSPHLPDGSENNVKLAMYTKAMNEVCAAKKVAFVDLFSPTKEMYPNATKHQTMNGIHLLEHGNKAIAGVIVDSLFGKAAPADDKELLRLRDAVLEKNYEWFSRYRVVDGYNVFGGRSKLAWFGQSNADVMKREMEIFDVKTENRDKKVWAVARGGDLDVVDSNLPSEIPVRTNKPGPLEGQKYGYLGGQEAISKMTIHEDMEVNLFASEEMFPRLVSPVQVAVDTDSRLWAAVWPSYPHWNPTEPRRDALLIFPDDDNDGVADECIVFADELNSITGFEFWNGGVLVAAAPEIWFLKDTDGDDKADVKIRMLQGVSSADSHHSANAVVVGPDGWMYWSRGIFNVANFETPTKTFRSGSSGVHRFNPRTFEFEFHFPIGPNPHGDVFDQWGYQFATDGTTGTGSYVNIGKGVGNKQWYKKRVRPVAATGILSGTGFPEQHEGNFLICNVIGVLGVLQHKVSYDGADITAKEIEPILLSSDQNFRPSDVEIGGDGALYVADWHNVLIGHMQHNMRDPNRDHEHGRIYRVTHKKGKLTTPAKMKGKPIAEVCEQFFARANSTRYRARLELTSRAAEDIKRDVSAFAEKLDPSRVSADRDEAQALLECLWVFEEQRIPNMALLQKVFQAKEPRVRAAAVRTLGHWAGKVEGWEPVLLAAAQDDEALVRAEAVKAAVDYDGSVVAEVFFKAGSRKSDPGMDSVLKFAKSQIPIDRIIADSIKAGRKLSPAAEAWALQNASAGTLVGMPSSGKVDMALLMRPGIPKQARLAAIERSSQRNSQTPAESAISAVRVAERMGAGGLDDLAGLLPEMDKLHLRDARPRLMELLEETKSAQVRTGVYAAWIQSHGGDAAWARAVQSRDGLTSILAALGMVRENELREPLYQSVRETMFRLPAGLGAKGDDKASSGPPVYYEYFQPNPANVAVETLAGLKPTLTGRMDNFATFVPGGRKDAFATKLVASIQAPATGEYSFFTRSDDGSRLYIDGREVVNNDGLHGLVERGGRVNLEAGLHEIIVTYFDNGGGDGLTVSWAGPGIRKQKIPAQALRVGSGNPRVQAINLIAAWPGHEAEKINDFGMLVAAESLTSPALRALAALPVLAVTEQLGRKSPEKILKAIVAEAGTASPVQRQSVEFSRLLQLGERLVATLDVDRNASERKLRDLRNSIPVKADAKVMALGKEVYHRESHCATCHQSHGQGMPNLYPPLDGSLWATGSEDRLIRIALDGMHGTIDVKGKRYSSPPLPPMTGFRSLLNDQELSAVLTYVRNTWSNRSKPVEAAAVAKVRSESGRDATFWFANDLLAKYPLEDGRKPIQVAARADGWTPTFVKKWKLADIDASKLTAGNRSMDTGKLFFTRLGCVQCHKLGGEGGQFGPDLSVLDAKKRNVNYILESLIDPSKDIEAKYSTRTFIMESGKVITGLIVGDKPNEYQVITDPLNPTKPTVVKKDEIDDESKGSTSIMPSGMLDWLSEDEILDLVAYVLAAGK
jgi:putative heme-binding domain-containing protein